MQNCLNGLCNFVYLGADDLRPIHAHEVDEYNYLKINLNASRCTIDLPNLIRGLNACRRSNGDLVLVAVEDLFQAQSSLVRLEFVSDVLGYLYNTLC